MWGFLFLIQKQWPRTWCGGSSVSLVLWLSVLLFSPSQASRMALGPLSLHYIFWVVERGMGRSRDIGQLSVLLILRKRSTFLEGLNQ